MSAKAAEKRELKGIGSELFIGALSILSIINQILLLVIRDDANLDTVLMIMNAILFPIFLGDFFYRFFTAANRSHYFFRGFGWADLLSSLPFPNLKILRLFRLWRVAPLFIRVGAENPLHGFLAHRAGHPLSTVFLLAVCVLQFGALAVVAAR